MMTDEKACVFIFTDEAACVDWLDKLRSVDGLTISREAMPAANVRASLQNAYEFIGDHISYHDPSEESGER